MLDEEFPCKSCCLLWRWVKRQAGTKVGLGFLTGAPRRLLQSISRATVRSCCAFRLVYPFASTGCQTDAYSSFLAARGFLCAGTLTVRWLSMPISLSSHAALG